MTFAAESYDAALCLGASFVFGSLADTVDALAPAVRPGGHVVVGEPYWRRLPLPDDYEDRADPWTTLDGTVADLRDLRAAGRLGDRVLGGRLGPVRDAPLAGRRALARRQPARSRCARDPHAARARKRHVPPPRPRLLGWAIFVGWKRHRLAIAGGASGHPRGAGVPRPRVRLPRTHARRRCSARSVLPVWAPTAPTSRSDGSRPGWTGVWRPTSERSRSCASVGSTSSP